MLLRCLEIHPYVRGTGEAINLVLPPQQSLLKEPSHGQVALYSTDGIYGHPPRLPPVSKDISSRRGSYELHYYACAPLFILSGA